MSDIETSAEFVERMPRFCIAGGRCRPGCELLDKTTARCRFVTLCDKLSLLCDKLMSAEVTIIENGHLHRPQKHGGTE